MVGLNRCDILSQEITSKPSYCLCLHQWGSACWFNVPGSGQAGQEFLNLVTAVEVRDILHSMGNACLAVPACVDRAYDVRDMHAAKCSFCVENAYIKLVIFHKACWNFIVKLCRWTFHKWFIFLKTYINLKIQFIGAFQERSSGTSWHPCH